MIIYLKSGQTIDMGDVTYVIIVQMKKHTYFIMRIMK